MLKVVIKWVEWTTEQEHVTKHIDITYGVGEIIALDDRNMYTVTELESTQLNWNEPLHYPLDMYLYETTLMVMANFLEPGNLP